MKLKIQFTTILPLLFLVLTFSSCKKYEEGPVTLRTPKNRLTDKDWVITENTVDGKSKTLAEDDKDDVFNFSDDGILTFNNGKKEYKGTWVFIDDKEKISATLILETGPIVLNYTIKKLTNDEFWVDITDVLGRKNEIHYEKKD